MKNETSKKKFKKRPHSSIKPTSSSLETPTMSNNSPSASAPILHLNKFPLSKCGNEIYVQGGNLHLHRRTGSEGRYVRLCVEELFVPVFEQASFLLEQIVPAAFHFSSINLFQREINENELNRFAVGDVSINFEFIGDYPRGKRTFIRQCTFQWCKRFFKQKRSRIAAF